MFCGCFWFWLDSELCCIDCSVFWCFIIFIEFVVDCNDVCYFVMGFMCGEELMLDGVIDCGCNCWYECLFVCFFYCNVIEEFLCKFEVVEGFRIV